jgi:hypothetical protein
VRIVRDGPIDGIARPGWGCQYTLALADLEDTATGSRLKAEVLAVTPFIFAPRVQFSHPVASATLNGESWSYFDGDTVFLPQAKGIYDLEITRGTGETPPHLTRTMAAVEECRWEDTDSALRLTTRLPPWTNEMPESQRFSATVAPEGRDLKSIKGAEVVRTGPQGINLRLLEPEATLQFK